jgi:hypothetical protein
MQTAFRDVTTRQVQVSERFLPFWKDVNVHGEYPRCMSVSLSDEHAAQLHNSAWNGRRPTTGWKFSLFSDHVSCYYAVVFWDVNKWNVIHLDTVTNFRTSGKWEISLPISFKSAYALHIWRHLCTFIACGVKHHLEVRPQHFYGANEEFRNIHYLTRKEKIQTIFWIGTLKWACNNAMDSILQLCQPND